MRAPQTLSMARSAFTNPVHPGYFADPFVLRHCGYYYAYGTNDVSDDERAFEVLRSSDLVGWTSLGRVLPCVDGLAARDHWAPEVVERDGLFWMYFSAGVEDRDHKLRLAVAERPEGPFRYEGCVLTPTERFAIDASPFRDDDGTWYLYYARDDLEGERVGTSLVVDRLVEMDRLAGKALPVLRPSADWQIFRRQRPMYGAIYDWHTLEAPFVVKRFGRYWCFYSGGAWTGAGYGVSFAVADTPLGPFAEPATDKPALLRTRGGGLTGPGHNSIVVGPDGADYIVYHAWDAGFGARRMCLDRLEWTPEGPRTRGPTSEPQPVPRRLELSFQPA
jgi:beta-xylosidase